MNHIDRADTANRASSFRNSSAAHVRQRRQRWSLVVGLLACLTGIGAPAAPAGKGPNPAFTPPGARDITVLDQNLYVGTEFTPLLLLDPTDPYYLEHLLAAVAQVYQALMASDFPRRAAAVADQIASTRPELVALQEVALIRAQVPGDLITGGTIPASDVQMDYLAVLLAHLNARGLEYTAVALVTNLDLELPMPTATPGVIADVRLTDHDVILARADLPPGHLRVSRPQAGNYLAALPLPSWDASIPRGWCSVDVTTRGRTFRFINTHLEENVAAPIQAMQAQELLAGPAATTLPVILVGDFNSDAYGQDGTTSYALLTQTLTDAWSVAHPTELGLTWGHDPLLADPTVEFIWRLDLVLFRGSPFQVLGMSRMSPQFQNTPPLWPSDHAAVVAHFRIR